MNIKAIPEFGLANPGEIADAIERMTPGDKVIIDGVMFEFVNTPDFAYPEPARYFLSAPMPEDNLRYSADPDRGYNFLHLRTRKTGAWSSMGNAVFTREYFVKMIRDNLAYIA